MEYKEGDRVLVEAQIVYVGVANLDGWVKIVDPVVIGRVPDGLISGDGWFKMDSIHKKLPRPLKVGDEVYRKQTGRRGKIVFMNDNIVLVETGEQIYTQYLPNEVALIEDEDKV